ncbi:hypothetical protein PAMP_013901 [Pampus punctatissimus]
MRFAALFLVLSLVVLMAEPSDGFIHHIFRGIFHVGKTIHGLITGRHRNRGQEQDQFDQRAFDRDRAASD